MRLASLVRLAIAVAPLAACGGEPSGVDFDLTCTVALDEIFDGGVDRDGIPALTHPSLTGADNATFLTDTSRVLGVVRNGVPRAYPFTVLWWHEMVNDTLGGEPLLVTYCPLTGSGIVFDPHVSGQVRNFGVSGLLFRSNLTMFDRTTETLWNQMLLAGMCGPDRGSELDRFPVVETTWKRWQELYPNTTVLTEATGFDRPYGFYPYGPYADPHDPNIQALTPRVRARITEDRPPKELVLGIFVDSMVVTYPFGVLEGIGLVTVVHDTVGAMPVVVTYQASDKTAIAFDRRVRGRELTFSVANESPLTLIDNETSSEWNALGTATSGTMAGEQLLPVADSYVAYWFAWQIYYRELELVLGK